jgi:ATP-dependent DNA helicase RecQ
VPGFDEQLQRFGLHSFRTGQRRVLDAVFSGVDCLCIMPTGGGKSLCYQLPAVAREGTVLVVSPLIALMQDQVEALEGRGISATFINSSLSVAQQQQRVTCMAEGRYDLVYIAPERMRSRSFLEALASTTVQLLAIDEAHCISQWGHDFRPDYARLGRLRHQIGSPQTIALTATATRTVQQDICQILQLQSPAVFVTGFARDNLALAVATPASNANKDGMLMEFLQSCPGNGIIYCATRKACDHLTEVLQGQLPRNVAAYHAGMDSAARRNIQEEFSSGKIEVIVATNAFGMGIDKSDLRFVIHYNLPGSVEAYYQEAGRAGRDGLPARCLMLYSWQDRFIQEFFIENSYPSPDVVRQVYQFLCNCPLDPVEMTLLELQQEIGLSIGTEGIRVSEALLEKAGAIERMDAQHNMASVRIRSDLPTLVDLLPREARARRKVLRGIESRIGPLRGERIFFAPNDLARQLDMTWESIQRNLRELNRLDCFDYVPAFRGRAIHVLQRRPFEELAIDFEELERRKQDEYRRLRSVIAFAASSRCRQREILEYFGDEDRQSCGRCDNCVSGSTMPALPGKGGRREIEGNEGAAYAVQVTLSGIARTHGRIGQTLIARMLCGSGAKKLKQLGLHRLSTHGLLKGLGQTSASDLIGYLVDAGLARKEETQRFRPVVAITDRGQEVLRGNHLESALSAIPRKMIDLLNRELGGKRPVLAGSDGPIGARRAAGNAGNDRDAESANPAPTLPDVGTDASDRTGPAAARPSRAAEPEWSRRDPTGSEAVPHSVIHPTWYWTWWLFSQGRSAAEIGEIRGLHGSELESHLRIAASQGHEIHNKWLSGLP